MNAATVLSSRRGRLRRLGAVLERLHRRLVRRLRGRPYRVLPGRGLALPGVPRRGWLDGLRRMQHRKPGRGVVMIIGTYIPHEIGEVVQGLVTENSGDVVGVAIPYKVLREVTERDWIAEQIADGFWGPEERARFRLNPRATNYYEVSVD